MLDWKYSVLGYQSKSGSKLMAQTSLESDKPMNANFAENKAEAWSTDQPAFGFKIAIFKHKEMCIFDKDKKLHLLNSVTLLLMFRSTEYIPHENRNAVVLHPEPPQIPRSH